MSKARSRPRRCLPIVAMRDDAPTGSGRCLKTPSASSSRFSLHRATTRLPDPDQGDDAVGFPPPDVAVLNALLLLFVGTESAPRGMGDDVPSHLWSGRWAVTVGRSEDPQPQPVLRGTGDPTRSGEVVTPCGASRGCSSRSARSPHGTGGAQDREEEDTHRERRGRNEPWMAHEPKGHSEADPRGMSVSMRGERRTEGRRAGGAMSLTRGTDPERGTPQPSHTLPVGPAGFHEMQPHVPRRDRERSGRLVLTALALLGRGGKKKGTHTLPAQHRATHTPQGGKDARTQHGGHGTRGEVTGRGSR